MKNKYIIIGGVALIAYLGWVFLSKKDKTVLKENLDTLDLTDPKPFKKGETPKFTTPVKPTDSQPTSRAVKGNVGKPAYTQPYEVVSSPILTPIDDSGSFPVNSWENPLIGASDKKGGRVELTLASNDFTQQTLR